MRTIEYGRYSSEYSGVTGRLITGRSIIVDGTSINEQGTGTTNPASYATLAGAEPYSRGKLFIRVSLDKLRSLIGHTPVILYSELRFGVYADTASTYTIDFYQTKLSPDFSDCDYRNRDATGPIRWYLDAYSPVVGQDLKSTPFDTQVVSIPTAVPTTWNAAVVITDVLADSLRRGTYLEMLVWRRPGDRIFFLWGIYSNICRPYLRTYYLFPIEFFLADSGGEIDLASMVDNLADENPYYLGAVERGETGTPVKGFWRNFSGVALPLTEVLDDHAEWSDPAQVAGAGTGSLDYVALAGAAGSQVYTVKFSSSTEYEVLAEDYRDNLESYHPAYDADPTWQGTTGTDFVAPEGGLTIPAAAWQPGTLVNDEFRIFVRGNSTDTTWPADSAEQTQMTRDSGGSPDAAGWRPVNGQRTRTRASVTVDATTKKFPTRAIDSALWPVGTRAFVGDGTNLHEGTVASAQEAELGVAVFAGAGLDDLTLSGNYNGTVEDDLVVEIEDDSASPELFKVSWDGGATWASTGLECSTTGTAIGNGVIATFGAIVGHTNGENWTAPVQPFAVELEGLTNDSTVYASGARVGTSLPFQNVAAGIWGRTTAAAGPSEAIDNRVYLHGQPPDEAAPAAAGFAMGQTIYLSDVTNTAVYEEAEIASVGTTYVDLTANLTNDYPSGALVAVKGSGEAAFWLRCVAAAGTLEELKQVRLNARV